jgi:hypothetical protein
MSGESLCFAFLAVGLPLFLLLRYARSRACSAQQRRTLKAMLIALVINTSVVLVATKAREARLFVLPLVLVFPLLGVAWRSEWQHQGGLRRLLRVLRSWPYALGALFALGIIILVSDHVFVLSDGVPSENLFHEYFMLQSAFMVLCVLADIQRPVGVTTPLE